jgi:ATP-binding cassette subfamily B protein
LVSQLSGIVFLVAVLGTSCYLVANQQMDLGVLVAISEMLGMLVPALNKLTLSNLQIQEAKIALDRLYEFVQTVGEDRTGEDSIPEEINSIAAVNLNFRFAGKKLLLTGMKFELNTGKLTVLLGESGGGKSTLLQVLTGFYPLSQDDISVNGQDSFQKFSSASWRKSIGYVPQEIKIFNGSLIYNLMLSELTESIETVIMLCKEIGMHTFFRFMPQGYFTLVGEEGINLSGGQRQLVGLVRALLQQPKLLLLDKFTGAMDRNTEQTILGLILRINEKIPVFVVTHRVKPALMADEVLIFEQGRLIDFGSPDQLLERENLLSSSVRDVANLR